MSHFNANAIKRQLAKLMAVTPSLEPEQGRGWLLLWRLDDLIKLVQDTTGQPRAAAVWFVVHKEAERLGIADRADVVGALAELSEAMERAEHPSARTTWQKREELQEVVRKSCTKAAVLILEAWGCPAGPLGPGPAGGRPPRLTELPVEWFESDQEENDEAADLDRLANDGNPHAGERT